MNLKNRNNYIHFLALAFMITLASCSTTTNKSGAVEAVEDVKEEALEAKQQLKKEYTETIKALDQKITSLEGELNGATDDAKAELLVTLDKLKNQRKQKAEGVSEISEATLESWDDIKEESEEILITYQAKIDSLTLEAEELIN
ncbi:hypothetical protein [Reichenbachiella sp.]|uniref:hypothetical protein n=1 Tax=Reichenbachiella sp. TaxID=2184521 RepID=UPI003BB131E5